MIFKIKSMMNPNKFTYAGVLEFTAEEGNCVLPEWMFDNMQFFSGCLAEITLVSNLPRGKLIKI
jgi:ubiquitin fusion degradation protein 1